MIIGGCPRCSPPRESNRLNLDTDANRHRNGVGGLALITGNVGGLGGLGGLALVTSSLPTVALRLERGEGLGGHELEGRLALEPSTNNLIELGDGTGLNRPNDVAPKGDGLHGRVESGELLEGEGARSGKGDSESRSTDLALDLSVLGDVDLGVLHVTGFLSFDFGCYCMCCLTYGINLPRFL